MSKAVNYNIPYGEDYWILTYSEVDYYRNTGQLWDVLTKFICDTEIERSVFTGRLIAKKRKQYRQFELILKDPTQSQYDFYKGLEGSEVTLTPHSDEDGITYTCIIQLTDLRYIKGNFRDPYLYIALTEGDEAQWAE